jgi:kynurenine formamidase
MALGLMARGAGAEGPGPQHLDLSLIVAQDYPCNWPTWPRFLMAPEPRVGPLGPYKAEVLFIDGNTGTQLDVPPHSVTPPGSGLPNAGPFGRAYTETIPAWQFGGEACVIDCTDLLDAAPPGRSALVTRDRIIAWERSHRPLGPGDVVLFRSGYSDKYYRPLPEGRRFLADPVEGKAPAWPDPDPDCMDYLAGRGVLALGTDSASMGPLPDLAEPTHFAGLRHGMIWTESATNLGALPTTGAFYAMLAPKHAGGAFSEGRAIAVVGDPLARRLIDAARAHRVADLSVVLADDLPVSWPGRGVGNHRQPYIRVRFGLNPNTKEPYDTHLMGSHDGTHLVPPSFALSGPGPDVAADPPEVRDWLAEYQKEFGPRGTSDVTADRVPIAQTCGPARIIDVARLAGTTDRASWPASPAITEDFIRADEDARGAIRPGDVVVFRSGWSDRSYRPGPEGKACLDDPLNGKAEGWPAPDPGAIRYLARRGVRCVATDAPSLGGVGPKRALMTYWALGGAGMAGVEYLTNLAKVPDGAYILFAAVKIRGCHGGPGRAIALW